MVSDRTVGTVATFIIVAFLAYYTFWLLVLPFVQNESEFTRFFPDVYYGLAIPTAFIIVGASIVLGYMGWLLVLQPH